MPPKKGAKKGKKVDDDEFWEKKEANVPTLTAPVANGSDEDEPPSRAKGKAAKSAFAMLEDETAGGAASDDDDAFASGGLMSAMRATKDRKKPKKSKQQHLSDDDEPAPAPAPAAAQQASLDDEWPEDDVKPKKGKKDKKKKGGAARMDRDEDDEGAPDAGKMDADEAPQPEPAQVANIEDEWPEDDVKPKKGKKDKKKKGGAAKKDEDEEDESAPAADKMDVDEAPQPAAAPVADIDDEWPEDDVKPKKGKKGKKDEVAGSETATPAEGSVADADETQEGEVKILSKKEKEKLKKEKEKAKKKAQAAAKKGSDAATPQAVPESSAPAPEAPAPAPAEAHEDEDEDEGDEGAVGGADKKKKKKKKKPAAEEKKEEPKGKPKKVSAHVLALQAAVERQKAIEAELRRKEEEERQRIEEEERRLEEEERLKEEAKALKKEKERAKREQARKEGRLLTPKQKAEKAAAEARMKALLASGVKVEGLEAGSNEAGPSKPKKVVYGRRKPAKKGGAETPESVKEPEPAPVQAPAPEEAKPASPAPAAEAAEDDWDNSDEEKVDDLVQGVKDVAIEDSGDDWDKSSGDEAAPPTKQDAVKAAHPPKAPAANGAPPTAKEFETPAKLTINGTAKTQPAAKEKAVVKEESSSEGSSEESSSEDDSDGSDSDDSESESESESSEEEMTPAQRKAAQEAEQRKAEAAARRKQRHEEAMAARSKDNLRSPICCILGHVDTGKTKLLDKIRQTNVQGGEAGGITQQIGATYFPVEAIKEKTQVVNKDGSLEYKIPGLLIIDTPGHESFTNLRTRGSSLCNIAILVVDITHGLEPQTLESIRLLKERRTPFIVALNKIDRLYGWEPTPNGGFRESYNKQGKGTQREFEDRLQATKTAFAEQGFNAELHDKNRDFGKYVSLVPTSAHTGEGVPDMIKLLVQLTQQRMSDRLMYLSELECTILEVKVIEGFGTTIDVVLSNGIMREGDKIVLCGTNGPIVTQVRALLTPQPLRELRVKSNYVHHKEVKAALGVKIAAPGLEKAIAGSRLLVCGEDDDEEELMEEVMQDLKGLEEFFDKSGKGVWVQASTLGSLEALLEFLRSSKIPVRGVNIGPVSKRDVTSASSMLQKAPEYAVMLCFDITVDKEARRYAEEQGVKIFEAQIIYHLFDAFTAYMKNVTAERQREAAPNAVWPCRLKILAAFAKRDPIVLGVDIIEGTLRTGTPLCVVKVDAEGNKEIIPLGKITSIEINKKPVDGVVKKSQVGAGAAIKIERASYQHAKQYGRHFDDSDEVISQISRQSIDVLKGTFREQVEPSDWVLIKQLKPKLNIP